MKRAVIPAILVAMVGLGWLLGAKVQISTRASAPTPAPAPASAKTWTEYQIVEVSALASDGVPMPPFILYTSNLSLNGPTLECEVYKCRLNGVETPVHQHASLKWSEIASITGTQGTP